MMLLYKFVQNQMNIKHFKNDPSLQEIWAYFSAM